MKKRLLSILLTLCMVLALMPVTVLAANSDFVIENGVLTKYNGPGGAVTIPNSVTSIEGYAFLDCSSLTDIYYDGSESQFKQINIEHDGNIALYLAAVHYNGGTGSGGTAPTTPSAPVPTSVVLSPQKLEVDGVTVDCEKYNIDGSNYFKLRDLAKLLSGTGSQFEVGYDGASNTVTITTGAAYTPAGGELAAGVDNSSTTQPSSQSILVDCAAHGELTVYNIGGSNFFQLRELGSLLGFEVDYDVATDTAIVRSAQK